MSVRFHAKPGETVVLRRRRGVRRDESTGGSVVGTLSFPTADLHPGEYDAELIDSSGEVVTSTVLPLPAWRDNDGLDEQVAYKVGEPIEVSWTKAPGMKWDWMSVFPAGRAQTTRTRDVLGRLLRQRQLPPLRVHARLDPRLDDPPRRIRAWRSLAGQPGTYEVRLLVDDGYRGRPCPRASRSSSPSRARVRARPGAPRASRAARPG